MYIDSGKDLKIDIITSPRPDKIGYGANKRTQVPIKPSPSVKVQTKSMKTQGAVTGKGEKYA